jgi:hypothetical protein
VIVFCDGGVVPRTKKAPGQAVDRRNGRRSELAAVRLEFFPLPSRRPVWLVATREAWAIAWEDPVSKLWTPADGPLLLRWADSFDRAARALRRADRKPIVLGSVGQVVEHPSYGTAERALRVAERCEQQLGFGALNRARLGLTVAEAQKSLDDLNRDFMGGSDDEPDPRLG